MARRQAPPRCATLFYRLAAQRVSEARLVFDKTDRTLTTITVYIAGYAVECALKAVLLARTPAAQHARVKASFRGRSAHDFNELRKLLRGRGVVLPVEVARDLGKMNWWSTDLRYQCGNVDEARAVDFVAAAEAVVDWAKRSL